MVDRHDMPRHRSIAHHASLRRKKSRISEALAHSVHAESSTSGARTSTSRRRVSPTSASLFPSSRRHQVSLIQTPMVPKSLGYCIHLILLILLMLMSQCYLLLLMLLSQSHLRMVRLLTMLGQRHLVEVM